MDKTLTPTSRTNHRVPTTRLSTPDSAAEVHFGEALGGHDGDVSDERKFAETIRGSAAVQIQNVANGSARVQGMYTLQRATRSKTCAGSAKLLACAVWLSGCSTTILRVSETQANQAVLALTQSGLSATTEAVGETTQVRVSNTDVAQALTILHNENLPHPEAAGLTETFATASLVPTPLEESVRVTQGLSNDLERTLTSLQGVTRARVHLSLPAPETWDPDAPTTAPTCSVLVQHRGAQPLTTVQVQTLIAGAVRNLQKDNVSVVFHAQSATLAPTNFARVGPFVTSPSGSSMLRNTLMVLLLSNLLCLGAAAFAFAKLRSARAATDRESA